jgi:hypothetical protein
MMQVHHHLPKNLAFHQVLRSPLLSVAVVVDGEFILPAQGGQGSLLSLESAGRTHERAGDFRALRHKVFAVKPFSR